MNADEFITFARDLIAQSPSGQIPQVVLRTSINRSYLGAYLVAKQILTRTLQRQYPDNYSAYGEVETDLEIEMPGFSDQLAGLRGYRTEADYDLEIEISRRKTEFAIELAFTLVTRMREKYN